MPLESVDVQDSLQCDRLNLQFWDFSK